MTVGGEIQIVVPGSLRAMLEELLDARGLELFKIPVEDDLPTYGIGFKEPS